MVEANPAAQSSEHLAQVEEQIFESIDEEIRSFHNWCKDFVQELSQRIETLSKKNLRVAKITLQHIRRNQKEIKEMVKQKAYDALKDRLANIVKTTERRDRILVGEEVEYRDQEGEVKVPSVLNGLAESEQAALNRLTRLNARIDGADLLTDISRKVAHTLSEIDQIMAQHGEAQDIETHTETFRRQLSEWDAKWKELQEDFLKVKAGEN